MTATLASALLVTTAVMGGAPRGVVLDFSATWCGPCQQMSPIVSRLERQGYAIRKVDVARERKLADRFGITNIPAFVLVVDGKEVTRIEGATSEAQLRRLCSQIPTDPPPVTATPKPRSKTPGSSLVELGEPSRFPTDVSTPQTRSQPQAPAARPPSAREIVQVAAAETPQSKPAKSGNLFGKFFGRKKKAATPPIVRGNNADQSAADENLLPIRDPMRASVRVHVTINGQTAVGSGTAIDSRPGRTVITSCGHLFKGWNEQSKVEVDVFAERGIQKFVGRMINYDVQADVGVVTIPTDTIIATANVPDVDHRPQEGDAVVNIGCSGGAVPTQEAGQITALNYYEGPDNVECTGIPVQGRSGGGLFNKDGQLVGVCIGADEQRQRGAYAGLLAIHDILNAADMSDLYRRPAVNTAVAQTTPERKSEFDPFARVDAPPASTTQPVVVTPPPPANADVVAAPVVGDDLEVICIIKNRRQPNVPSRVVIIDRPSPSFLSYLGNETVEPVLTSESDAVQTNRIGTSAIRRASRTSTTPTSTTPQRLADPRQLFSTPTSSRPLFTTPGSLRGEHPRGASLRPTALESAFVPQRYVRSR